MYIEFEVKEGEDVTELVDLAVKKNNLSSEMKEALEIYINRKL